MFVLSRFINLNSFYLNMRKEKIKEKMEKGKKEADVYSDDGTAIQSQQYSAILNACISEPGCIAWRGWILTDKYDIFEDGGQVEFGEDGLFSKTMKPRPALSAMQQILK